MNLARIRSEYLWCLSDARLLDFMHHCRENYRACATTFGRAYHERRFNNAARVLRSRGYRIPLMAGGELQHD